MKRTLASSQNGLKLICSLLFFLLPFATTIQIQAQANKANSFPRDSIIAAAREIIGNLKYCAIITLDSTGTTSVRTMNPFPPEEDMSVWMATNTRSRKIDEIKKNPNVTLYYANHAAVDGYVAIKGKAVLVTDPVEIQKRKREYWKQAFPDFKYLVLIKVVPERLEVINYKHKMYNSEPTWLAPYIEFNK